MPRDDTGFDMCAALELGFDWSQERIMLLDVTPAMAEALLNSNTKNRPLTSGRVEEYAAEMRAGRFPFNGDTVRFDTEAKMLDGQHRLWAIIETDVTMRMLLVFGLDPECFDTIDIGKIRTGPDTVWNLGEDRYRAEIASACQWLVRWQRGDLDTSARARKVTNTEVKEVYRDNADLVISVELCTALRSIGTVGILSAVHYRVAQRDAELAERMLATLREPAGVAVNDPFFVLRDTLLNMRRSCGRRDPIMVLALAIKTVNAAAQGRKMKRLSWRPHRAAGSFPVLDVPLKRVQG